MSRALAAACCVLATLAVSACARTQDLYVGSHFEPDMAQPEAGGGSTPTTTPDAGSATTGTAGRAAGAGAAGSGGSAGSAGSAGSTPLPPPVLVDAGVAPTCATGTADCDGDAGNGCETDVTNDAMNCGDCGVACQSADCVCVDGVRVLDCPAGRDDCDGDASNGCETDLASDAQHCGACGTACTGGAGIASATCGAGVCALTCALPTLRGDCDGDPSNGCETDLYHDVNNCSACGKQCSACLDARCL